MIKVNIHEAKTHLSKYVKKAQKGHKVVLCIRNVPVAEIRPLEPPVDRKKAFELMAKNRDKVVIHPEFFDPMPDEFLAYFDGRK